MRKEADLVNPSPTETCEHITVAVFFFFFTHVRFYIKSINVKSFI